MNAREEYEKKLLERNSQAAPASEAAKTFQETAQNAGGQIASSQAQQGNIPGTLGGAAMMSGNPYLMAGGLGLQVLAAGEQNKRAAVEKQRVEYNERIARRQEMMSNIAKMGIQ